ncbi:MAG TPA: AMP-binding protein, partial [Steroidobacteraceae bacterium]|nr:AMP-binding protein [Steroidobacteraceae bacterium]
MSEIWRPTPSRVADANLTHFMRCVSARRALAIGSHDELYRWSIEEPADFWEELARFTAVQADWGSGPTLEYPDRMPGARFFPQARLNFAQNLLRFRDEQPALIFRNEAGARRRLSYRELQAEVARIADGLKGAGILRGDRIAGFLPNLPEAVIAMLATASLGAVWSSCSAEFGVPGVLDRFGQIAPKVIFAADGYLYAGKRIDCL